MPPRLRRSTVGLAVSGGAVTGLGVLAGTAWLMTRSLDRTDEGYYLTAMAYPEDDRATVLLFGWVLHPLHVLVGGDVLALRWSGLGISAVLVMVLGWTLMSAVLPDRLRGRRRLVTALLVAGTWSASCAWLVLQLPMTPGYNTLAFGGLCLVAAGATNVLARPPVHRWSGAVMVGLGGTIAAFGKPTTALLAGLLVAVAFLAAGHARPAALAALTSSAAAVVVLSLAHIGPGEVAARLLAGWEYQQTLAAHEALLRLDPFPVPDRPAWSRGTWLPALTFVVLVLPAVDALTRRVRTPVATSSTRDRSRTLLTALLLLLPAAYALGTNTNLWAAMGRAGVFWVAAATLILASGRPEGSVLRLASPGMLMVALLVPMLAAASAVPWRYPAARGADVMTRVDVHGSTLGLVASDAASTAQRLTLVMRAGLRPGTRVLDLTGAGSGYLHEWGARPVGRAWLIGGYPGSDEAAGQVLRDHPCEARQAWLLTAADSPRSLDPAVLAAAGLDLETDFTAHVSFRASPSSPFAEEAGTLTLWAPNVVRVDDC